MQNALAHVPREQIPAPSLAPAERVFGFDLARALAIFGMVVVHFSLVMADGRTGPGWLSAALGFLDGRAAATFVILAGIGVTLMSQRAVKGADPLAITKVRAALIRRGLFLLALGFINLRIWPGESFACTAFRCCWQLGSSLRPIGGYCSAPWDTRWASWRCFSCWISKKTGTGRR
jgi:uncharacterized membrane protein